MALAFIGGGQARPAECPEKSLSSQLLGNISSGCPSLSRSRKRPITPGVLRWISAGGKGWEFSGLPQPPLPYNGTNESKINE